MGEVMKSRKMSNTLLFLTVLFSVILLGCSDDNPDRPLPEYPTLIHHYTEFVGLGEIPSEGIQDYRNIHIMPWEGWDVYAFNNPHEHTYMDEWNPLSYPEKGLFENLCELNGDTAFRASVQSYDVLSVNKWMQSAFIEDIIDLHVEALTPYDGQHPKGKSLTDIASVSYKAIYPYVHEGYVFNTNSIGNGYHSLCLEADPTIDDNELSCTLQDEDKSASKELIYHCRATDIAANPLRMVVPAKIIVSLATPPTKDATVRVSVTVKRRGGSYSARTYHHDYDVRK